MRKGYDVGNQLTKFWGSLSYGKMTVVMEEMQCGSVLGCEKGCGEAHESNSQQFTFAPTMCHACFKHRDIAANKRHR